MTQRLLLALLPERSLRAGPPVLGLVRWFPAAAAASTTGYLPCSLRES